jgi:hypothetical protein
MTKEDMNYKTIAGVEFEAIRFDRPVKHWRPKVIKTGEIIGVCVFKGDSRPKLWADMERACKIIGSERFKNEMEGKEREEFD